MNDSRRRTRNWAVGVLMLGAALPGVQRAAAQQLATPDAKQLWSDPNIDLGGGESMVTGVAARGATAWVAVSGKTASGEWAGQVRCYDATKAYKWSSDVFPLDDGRTDQIVVAGAKVFVGGYYGEAGSGNEEVFLRAYDAAGKKGLLWEASTSAPFCGLYPSGVRVAGSRIVAFSNSGPAGQVKGSFAGFSPAQKDGQPRWLADFDNSGNPSSQVNDVAVNGAKFAAVGTILDAAGRNWFALDVHSAVNGDWNEGTGRSFGAAGDVNEAVSVAWVGSYLVAVGRVTDGGSVKGYLWALKVTPHGSEEAWTEEASEGADTTINCVAMAGTRAYAAGYGKADAETQWAFVKAFGLAPGTPKHPKGDLWSADFNNNNLFTTGIAVGKNAVYTSAFGFTGSATDWFVLATDLSGHARWQQDYNLAGQDLNRAAAIVATRKAVIVVGQCRNAAGGLSGVVEALAP